MGFFDFFPYTNFHNVNLDWVLQRVKEWGELVQANDIAFHNLEEANASFKEYVTNYLANLDVQDEINNKMDSLLESGVLTEYLQPYVSEDVTAWLDEHITEPTGVVIDTSLTVSGACADAKSVGDRFIELNVDLGDIPDIKNAIIDCFRQVAWLDGTLGARAFENLLGAFNISDFYNTWEWSYPGNINMYKGTPSFLDGSSTDGIWFRNSQLYVGNKRTVFVDMGKLEVVEEVSTAGDLYPIPIPAGATSVRVSINPSNMQVLIQRWRLQGNVYKLDGISTWQTGTAIFTFSSAHNTFICLNIRYNSSQSAFPSEPQGLEITFE